MEYTSNSDKITRDYFDSLLLESRYIDSDLPSTKFELYGRSFDTPVMTAALSHLGNTAENGMVIYAQAAAKANAVHWVGMGEDKELDVTFDRASTNDYRNDTKFRIHLLNTVYKIRFAKVVIGIDDTGNDIVELLMTILPKEEVSTDELKECYWLRWGTETSYNRLKNRMSTEEFSGYKPILIKQDIYADAWLFNLVSLKIKEADQKKPAEQKNGSYTVSRNFNKVLGTLKSSLLKALTTQDKQERSRLMALIDENINSALCWVKNGERNFERKTAVNKSKMSYRRTY